MVVRVHSEPSKIYIYHVDHEHDRIYVENIVEFLGTQGVAAKVIQLSGDGPRPELQECLDDPTAAVLGFNSTLDRSWLPSGRFLDAAERTGLPVMQWILDHPSARWPQFEVSSPTNSRFLLNSEQQQRYFETYCLPGAMTAATGGIGPNWRSRVGEPSFAAFMQRPLTCLVPLNLHRIRSLEQHEAALGSLDRPLAHAVHRAVARARADLFGSLHAHVAAALANDRRSVAPETFNLLCQLVEEAVQTYRRQQIFSIARNFPVLVQSDEAAVCFVVGRAATFAGNVGMQATLERIPACRAVLSVTPINDMIHDRTMNALNAGCVAIAEDNAANRDVFTHGENALLFRYDDASLAECLDILCGQPQRAHQIALAGMQLRDDPRIRFGQFRNIVDLARRG